jgi:cytoskeletal protein CcmA (bactofilin family)
LTLRARAANDRRRGAEGARDGEPQQKEAVVAIPKDLAPTESRSEALATIGHGTRISGKLRFDGDARIDGTVEGEVTAGETLQIGERASVNAQMTAGVIVIRGTVTGDVHARKRLEIRAPGKLHGNVTTPSLLVDEGVVFEGHCSMGGDAPKPPAARS